MTTQTKLTLTVFGDGLIGMLQIIFIIMKLMGKITWSWSKVLIPLWIDLIATGTLMLVLWIVIRRDSSKGKNR